MAALALAVLAAALFWPLARAGFVYDDLWIVVRNPALLHITPTAFLLRPATFAMPGSPLALDNFRPLATLSLAVDRAAWGLTPAFFHIENVAWHLLNACLVGALSRRWLRDERAAWAAACAFLVHPVQVETVAWVSQRSNLLCATGLLAALWLLTRPDARRRHLASGLAAYAFALLSKEEALVLLPLLWLCDWAASRRPRWRLYAAAAGLTAGYLLARAWIGHPWSQLASARGAFGSGLMLGALSFAVYLGKLALPTALRASYNYPGLDAWAVAGAAVLSAVYFAAAWAARRSRTVLLALFWIPIALLPVLHLAPIGPFVAERFLYLAVVGAGLLAGKVYERGGLWRWGVGVWLLGLAVQTAGAVPHWKSERSLWAAAVAAEPTNAFARVCYAQALEDPAQAEAQYKAALVDQPSETARFAALNNLSNLLLRQGRARGAAYWARLALRGQPQEEHALYNLCRAYSVSGDPRRGAVCAALARRQSAPSLP